MMLCAKSRVSGNESDGLTERREQKTWLNSEIGKIKICKCCATVWIRSEICEEGLRVSQINRSERDARQQVTEGGNGRGGVSVVG